MIDWAEIVMNGSRIGLHQSEWRAAMPQYSLDRLLSASPIQTILNAPHIPAIGTNPIPNVTLTYSNADGVVSRAFEDRSPVGATLNCYDKNDDLVFSGTLDTANFGATGQLTAVAFLATDLLPLRSTAEWGEYVNIATIPEVVGDCSNKFCRTIPYDADGFEHCFSNGAAEVTEIQIDGQDTPEFSYEVIRDRADKSITIIRLPAALAEGSVLTASGLGARKPASGELIENPADLVDYYIVERAGKTIPAAHLDRLRLQCNAHNVRIAYQFTGPMTLAAMLNDLAQAVGMAWTYGSWQLFPLAGASRVYDFEYENFVDDGESLETKLANSFNVVKINFLYHPALADYARSLTVKADSYLFTEDKPLEIFSQWLSSDLAAFEYASRLAAYLSRYVLAGSFALKADPEFTIRLGEYHGLLHPRLPFPDTAPALFYGLVPAETQYAVNALIEGPATFATRLLLDASRLAMPQLGGVQQAEDEGKVTLTIYDENDRIAPGALVTLDNGETKVADAAGQVIFTNVAPGLHTITWLIEGYDAQSLQIRTGAPT